MSEFNVEYSEAQEKLVAAFRQLAVAQQAFDKVGGVVEYKIYRQELLLNIKDGVSIGFLIPSSQTL